MSIIKIVKAFIIVFVVAVVGVIVIFISNVNNKNTSINTINSKQTEIKMLNMDDDVIMVLYEVAKKNGNWSNLPLSNNFKKKYNSKDGIFKGDNYTYCSTKEDSSFDKTNHIVCYNIEHNYKNEWYYVHYTINDNNELDDVEIVDKILRYDENGEEVIYKETMNGAFISNIIQLAAPYRLEWNPYDYIYVTDHYEKKWGGGFIPYFEIDIKDENNAYIGINPYDIICNKEKQDVYFSVEYTYIENDGTPEAELVCDYIKYFKVHYITNEKAWLDDVEVEEISKEEIDKLLEQKKVEEKQ